MHSRHNQHVNLAFVDGHVNAHDHNTIISKIKKMHKDGLGTGNMPDYLRKHTATSRKQSKLYSRTTTRKRYVANNTNIGMIPGD